MYFQWLYICDCPMFRVSTLITFKMWFAAILTSQHSGISAVESDLQNPALKSLESIALHKAKPSAKGKIKEYGIGALLLPSSSQQNHELMIDHISIMKLPAFWCIRQDQCLNLPGLAKWLQKLSRDVCSYPKTGSVCRDRVTVHKKHHSRGVKTVSYWSLVLH